MTEVRSPAVRGLGIDLVSISRFKDALDRWGCRMTRRLFTPAELDYCFSKGRPEVHLAARFAAKEAFLKALGTGLSRGIAFTDVEIVASTGAPPTISLHNRALVISVSSSLSECHLSITHSGDYAAACVVATGESRRGGP